MPSICGFFPDLLSQHVFCCIPPLALMTWVYLKVVVDVLAGTALLFGFDYAYKNGLGWDYLALSLNIVMIYLLYMDIQFTIAMCIGLAKKIHATRKMAPYYRRGKKLIIGITILSACVIVASPYRQIWPFLDEKSSFQWSDITPYIVQFVDGLAWIMMDSTIIWKAERDLFAVRQEAADRFIRSGCLCPGNESKIENETKVNMNIDVEENAPMIPEKLNTTINLSSYK